MISAAQLKRAVTGKRVLIDSNIIIYLTDAIEPYQNLAKRLFEMIEAGQSDAVISVLSVGEVMQGPLKLSNHTLAMQVRDYLVNFPNCRCQEITFDVLGWVGRDGRIAWQGLRVMDSLIVASGLANGVDLFVSNGRHFKQAIPQSMMLSLD